MNWSAGYSRRPGFLLRKRREFPWFGSPTLHIRKSEFDPQLQCRTGRDISENALDRQSAEGRTVRGWIDLLDQLTPLIPRINAIIGHKNANRLEPIPMLLPSVLSLTLALANDGICRHRHANCPNGRQETPYIRPVMHKAAQMRPKIHLGQLALSMLFRSRLDTANFDLARQWKHAQFSAGEAKTLTPVPPGRG